MRTLGFLTKSYYTAGLAETSGTEILSKEQGRSPLTTYQ